LRHQHHRRQGERKSKALYSHDRPVVAFANRHCGTAPKSISLDFMAAASSSADTAVARDKKITSFFSLPPELRDLIYDFCFQDEEQQCLQCGSIGTPHFNSRASLPQLRLAKRRVQTEYDRRWPLNSSLNFSLTSYNPILKAFERPVPRPPRLAAMSTVVSVDLEFHGFVKVHWDLPRYLTILDFVLPALPTLVEDLPHLEKLVVSMHFLYESCGWAQKVIRAFEKLDAVFEDVKAGYPQLARLVELNAMNAFCSERDGVEYVKFVTWSPNGGIKYDKEGLVARLRCCSSLTKCPGRGREYS